MRRFAFTLMILVSLTFANPCRAQFNFGTTQNGPVNRLSGANRTGYLTPTTYLGSGFRLSNLFYPFRNSNISNRTNIGYSTVPDSSDPNYLQYFGFKRYR